MSESVVGDVVVVVGPDVGAIVGVGVVAVTSVVVISSPVMTTRKMVGNVVIFVFFCSSLIIIGWRIEIMGEV